VGILFGADDDIFAGHARLMAALKLGLTEALNSGGDEELLRIELALLHEEDYNLDLVGFEDAVP
jgi:hypothetical protein